MCAGVEPSSREPLFKEELNLLYDSKCSVCQWEVDMLTSLGAEGKILFTDIEAPGFDQASPLNGGVSYEEAMKSMTAVTRHGEILSGVPVFEALYKQVGFGWLFTAARLPIVGSLVDGAYLIFAAFRTSLTRGKSVQELIAERNAALASCEPCQSKVEL
jgi:predicted DCC family thiol-disulfide oxidoreductase YuxK